MKNKNIANKIVCIVQARMTSSRLPGKVLKTLGRRTVLGQVFNQLSYSQYMSRLVLATSIDESDDPLVEWAENADINYYRGNLDDVLDRFYSAAKENSAGVVVRITADCPLIDPEIADRVIELFLENKADYASNTLPPTYPDGLDVEVFTFQTLERAWNTAQLKSEREHVTPYIRNNPGIFNMVNLKNETDLSSMRWTLDNHEDYILLSKVFEHLSKEDNFIKMEDVLNFLECNKDLMDINKHIKRNEGYEKSLINDSK